MSRATINESVVVLMGLLKRGQYDKALNYSHLVNYSIANENTPLIDACKSNNFKNVKFIVEKLKADVNLTCNCLNNKTALDYALENNNTEIVKYLVSLNAFVNEKNKNKVREICGNDYKVKEMGGNNYNLKNNSIKQFFNFLQKRNYGTTKKNNSIITPFNLIKFLFGDDKTKDNESKIYNPIKNDIPINYCFIIHNSYFLKKYKSEIYDKILMKFGNDEKNYFSFYEFSGHHYDVIACFKKIQNASELLLEKKIYSHDETGTYFYYCLYDILQKHTGNNNLNVLTHFIILVSGHDNSDFNFENLKTSIFEFSNAQKIKISIYRCDEALKDKNIDSLKYVTFIKVYDIENIENIKNLITY